MANSLLFSLKRNIEMFKPENQLARFELSFLCYLILLHLKKKKVGMGSKGNFIKYLTMHIIYVNRQIKYS